MRCSPARTFSHTEKRLDHGSVSMVVRLVTPEPAHGENALAAEMDVLRLTIRLRMVRPGESFGS